ncbi:LIM and SH3 domain protein F42H10.3-like isoform X1 [Daphnia pulicaria]|uniref:LIM and SH3 domain protein F42H10.3-like isoform X1 n=1 Tax=Daphnia pulicaria TaxID=35523 RepID=UPI001EEBBC46|nr:LIM and SH3 domain protein F42H10.3-like isoform X1 [Daphnia pulicaria]
MSKSCSRCDKAVYPTEELKCLDKLWHKTCFKCQTCSMALNMKTYKGFNKLPYCEAHIPKAKATTVVETPEMRRLAENTKLQSQVQYHADFEKAKGKFTQVADDPETLRIKANTKIISNVSYHGDLEKKAAMEQKRTLTGDEANGHENSVPVEDVQPDPIVEVIPQHQRSVPTALPSPPHHQQQQYPQHHSKYPQQQQQQLHQHPDNHHIQSLHRQTEMKTSSIRTGAPNSDSSQNTRSTTSSTVVYCSQPNMLANQSPGRRAGSINDYDPVNENYGSQGQQGYRLTGQQPTQYAQQQQQQQTQQQQQQTQQQKLQQYYQQQQRQHALHVQQQQAMQQQAMQQQQQVMQQQQQALQQQQQQAMQQQQALRHQQHTMSQQSSYTGSVGVSSGYHQAANTQPRSSGRSFRAMYDYDADDDDEVSFRDGDVIVDCKPIDEGWMMGTVLRTGRSGMVPANYIEPIN